MARRYTTDYWPHRNTMNRQDDWHAVLGDYDQGDPVGSGPTELDAIADLVCQLDDLENAEDFDD